MSDNKANLLEAVFEHYDWTTRPATVSVVGSVLSTMTRTRCEHQSVHGIVDVLRLRRKRMVTRSLRLERAILQTLTESQREFMTEATEVRGSVSSITGSRLLAPKKHRSGKGGTYVPPWSRL